MYLKMHCIFNIFYSRSLFSLIFIDHNQMTIKKSAIATIIKIKQVITFYD